MNILFDLDGTLTDPFEGITKCIAHALLTLGRSVPDRQDLRWCIGPPLRESFGKLLDTDDQRATERAVGTYRDRFNEVGIFENEVYDGIPETLSYLRKIELNLFVATAKPVVYAEKIVDHFGLRQYFAAIYGSEMDGARSDKSELITHILNSESLSPADVVMVGDREHDMRGATANDVPGIGVLWGYGTREELEASGAMTCVNNPKELTSVVEALRGHRD